MKAGYRNETFRIIIESDDHDSGWSFCHLEIRDGFNDECSFKSSYLSLEECHTLRHFLDRVIANVK